MKELTIDKYRCIFFDLFHTLTYPGIHNYSINEWDIFNITEDYWTLHSMKTYHPRGIGQITEPEQIVKNILISGRIPFNDRQIREATRLRIEKFKNCLVNVNRDIIDTLNYLYTKGKRLCLISNSDVVDKMGWNMSPINKYFEQAVFSCDVGILKPSRDIYRIAIDKMKANPESTLYVGDGGSNEFLGAKIFNMDTLLTTEFVMDLWPEKIDEFRKDADFVINKLKELAS